MSTRRVLTVVGVIVGTPLAIAGGSVMYVQYKIRNYPQPARKHLRRALLTHHYGQGEALVPWEYEQAIKESLRGGLSSASPEVTGILEHLADFYDQIGDHSAQRQTLDRLFKSVTHSSTRADDDADHEDAHEGSAASSGSDGAFTNESHADKVRRLKTALKAAQWMADAADRAGDTAALQSSLEWIVAESLVIPSPKPQPAQSSSNSSNTDALATPANAAEPVVLSQLELHEWASVRQLGSAFERLGRIYSSRGLISWAVPVYMRALELLHRDRDLGVQERACHSAVIHNNIAETFAQVSDSQDALNQALHFANLAIETAQDRGGCGECEPVAMYNAASILAQLGRKRDAVMLYRRALERSRAIGFEDGVAKSQLALKQQ